MNTYNVDVYVDDIYVKTIRVQASDPEQAEDHVADNINIQFSVEELDG